MLSPVSRFFMQVFLWLPLCFGGWYYLGNLFMLIPNGLADAYLSHVFPELIAGLNPQGSLLEVSLNYAPPDIAPGGQIVLSMNMLKYGYSMPLYTALILASPAANDTVRWLRWGLGMMVLFMTTAWGISFDVMKTILFSLKPEISEYARAMFNAWQLNGFALAYQFGYLILPAITPLILWIGFYRDFLAQLVYRNQ